MARILQKNRCCCEPLICGKKWARIPIKISIISTGIFRAKFDLGPEMLTFRKPNSIKFINFINRKYHAKNIIIDLYIFIHILNRCCRLDLPGNLAEIS